jgi:hypothetical protein
VGPGAPCPAAAACLSFCVVLVPVLCRSIFILMFVWQFGYGYQACLRFAFSSSLVITFAALCLCGMIMIVIFILLEPVVHRQTCKAAKLCVSAAVQNAGSTLGAARAYKHSTTPYHCIVSSCRVHELNRGSLGYDAHATICDPPELLVTSEPVLSMVSITRQPLRCRLAIFADVWYW